MGSKIVTAILSTLLASASYGESDVPPAPGPSVTANTPTTRSAALVLKATKLADQNASFVGMRGGVHFYSNLIFGVEGYALPKKIDYKDDDFSGQLDLSYGGLSLGYQVWEQDNFFITFSTLVGWGTVFSRSNATVPDTGLRSQSVSHFLVRDQMTVIEPEITFENAITENFSVAVGAGYRSTTGVDKNVAGNLDAPTAVASFIYTAY
ncbi:MAG: hypothetical protein AB7T49_01595 [Oligoflexales bacterium]